MLEHLSQTLPTHSIILTFLVVSVTFTTPEIFNICERSIHFGCLTFQLTEKYSMLY